jgi:hypothetical protein
VARDLVFNAFIYFALIVEALRQPWIAPCSVKASGSLRRPPRPLFDVAFCNIKDENSSADILKAIRL